MELEDQELIDQVEINIVNGNHMQLRSYPWECNNPFSIHAYDHMNTYTRTFHGFTNYIHCVTSNDAPTYVLKPWTCTQIEGNNILVFDKVTNLLPYLNAEGNNVCVNIQNHKPYAPTSRLRDVTRGLMRGMCNIYVSRLTIENIRESVVITEYSEVRFIRLIEDYSIQERTIRDFINIIEQLQFFVPQLYELISYTHMLRTSYSYDYFYNHPYFWTLEHRYHYIMNIYVEFEINPSDRESQEKQQNISGVITHIVQYIESKYSVNHWSVMFLEGSMYFTLATGGNYNKSKDLIRYIRNLDNHNWTNYGEIDCMIYSTFPDLLPLLYEHLGNLVPHPRPIIFVWSDLYH
ncbi:uncharacterized protein LOC122087471 [Macadamia integrifolia]|uniref:uncharacterized protein LOC122087471 n=1 Tax=Macadamia integrifolia TaxID=60698 RepID=UPI001C4E9C28|nr:uncharacterized protein LOC122087471 [Macadamia integrifolia]